MPFLKILCEYGRTITARTFVYFKSTFPLFSLILFLCQISRSDKQFWLLRNSFFKSEHCAETKCTSEFQHSHLRTWIIWEISKTSSFKRQKKVRIDFIFHDPKRVKFNITNVHLHIYTLDGNLNVAQKLNLVSHWAIRYPKSSLFRTSFSSVMVFSFLPVSFTLYFQTRLAIKKNRKCVKICFLLRKATKTAVRLQNILRTMLQV